MLNALKRTSFSILYEETTKSVALFTFSPARNVEKTKNVGCRRADRGRQQADTPRSDVPKPDLFEIKRIFNNTSSRDSDS